MDAPYSYKAIQQPPKSFSESAGVAKADRGKAAIGDSHIALQPACEETAVEPRAKEIGLKLVNAIAAYKGVPDPVHGDLVRFSALAGQNREAAEKFLMHLLGNHGEDRPIPVPGSDKSFPQRGIWNAVHSWLARECEQAVPAVKGNPVWYLTWSQEIEGQEPLGWEGRKVFQDGPDPRKAQPTEVMELAAEAQKRGYNVVGPDVLPAEFQGNTLVQTYIDGTVEVLEAVTPEEYAEICARYIEATNPNVIAQVVA